MFNFKIIIFWIFNLSVSHVEEYSVLHEFFWMAACNANRLKPMRKLSIALVVVEKFNHPRHYKHLTKKF